MNKIVVGLGIIVLAVVGWLMFQGDVVDYVADVDSEVAALEKELAEIDAAVAAGTLTPTAAAMAQARIVARIDTIDAAVNAGQKAKLTDAQKAELASGLVRFKQALVSYSATLSAVDKKVLELPAAERPTYNRGGSGGGRTSVAAIAVEAAADVDGQVDDIIADIEDEAIAADAEADADAAVDVESEDDSNSASSTDETVADDSDDSASSTEPTVEVDPDVDVSAEGEADVSISDEDPVLN